MPQEPDGTYSKIKVIQWRRSQPEPPEWLHTANEHLPPAIASGDLVRAVFRVLLFTILDCADAINNDEKITIAAKERVFAHMKANLSPFVLDDEQIEKLLQDCWRCI